MKPLRANLWLLGMTVTICCVLYPTVLYGLGRTLFADVASGSVTNAGSPLIAQPFTGDEYFWPRPSAASYNGAAAGGSNWGASNPKLRDRVAQQLGPIIAYKAGSKFAGPGPNPRTPQQDMEAWFTQQPPVEPVVTGAALHATIFDSWLSDPANAPKVADLEPVPADMVTASGSGLDPHITLRNALSIYQLDRVAKKRSVSSTEIANLVSSKSFVPLSGLVGEPLVNVLELNRELDRQFPGQTAR
ncbi:potassium-transporting ATPase subunit KdpC [soil metagenome]